MSGSVRIRLTAGLVAALCGASACALAGDWATSGPLGGSVQWISGHHADPEVLILGTAQGDLFRSSDGGVSWARDQAGLGMTSLGWRSVPVGTSRWIVHSHLVAGMFLDEGTPSSWRFNPGSPRIGGIFQTLSQVAAAPTTPNRVYAVSTDGAVFRSDDGGRHWQQAGQLPAPSSGSFSSFAISPQDPDVLFLVSADGLRRSLNGGEDWTLVSDADGWMGNRGTRVVLDPDALASGYVITWPQVYSLTAGGDGLDEPQSMPNGHVDGYLNAAFGSQGAWFVRPPALFAPLAQGGWQEVDSPALNVAPDHRAGAVSISVTPRLGQPDVVVLGTYGPGVFVSDDGGSDWSSANAGLDAVAVRAVAVAPGAPSLVLAGQDETPDPLPVFLGPSTEFGMRALFRSETGPAGAWQSLNVPIRFVRDIVFDASTKGSPESLRVYAVGDGVFRSDDGGLNWIDLGGRSDALGGFPEAPGVVRSLVLTSTPGTLVAATNLGVYRSTDYGVNWVRITDGLQVGAQQSFITLEQSTADADVIVAGAWADIQSTPDALPNVFRSIDGGLTWTAAATMGLPQPVPEPQAPGLYYHWMARAVVMHPNDPDTLWIATEFLGATVGSPGRIYRSVDGGASWQRSDHGLMGDETVDMAIDPNDGQHLFATRTRGGAQGGTLYRSRDGGETWHRYGGSLDDRVNGSARIVLDPNDPARIVLATRNGVHTRLLDGDDDLDGIEDAVENAAPNSGDGNDDGEPDRMQAHVASLPLAGHGWPDGSAEPGGFVTVWADPVEGECAQLEEVRALHREGFPTDSIDPPGYTHPLGLIAFELRRCQRADVYFRVHGADFAKTPPVLRLYGPTAPWASASRWFHAPGEVEAVGLNTIRVRLESTSPGNLRNDPDNIRFMGSLGVSSRVFAVGFEAN